MSGFFEPSQHAARDGYSTARLDGETYFLAVDPGCYKVIVTRSSDGAEVTISRMEFIELGFDRCAPMTAPQFVHAFRTKWEKPDE